LFKLLLRLIFAFVTNSKKLPKPPESFHRHSHSFTKDLVRERFHETMRNNSTATLSSWLINYEQEVSSQVDKNALSNYARDVDIRKFADKISNPLEQISQIRSWVQYITSPTNNEKTSRVLPAFLKMNLTHYFYIAFSNNAQYLSLRHP
jgi:hypothetical protein